MATSAARVAGSIVSPNREANRTARIRRSLSSPKSGLGIADGAEDPGLEVGLAADVVDQRVVQGIEEHPVDREVAPRGVELGRAEDDRLGAAAVDVGPVAAEGRDLDLDRRWPAGSRTRTTPNAAPTGIVRWRKTFITWSGVALGGDVVVAGGLAEQQVAHATARPEGLMPRVAKPADDLRGKLAAELSDRHRPLPIRAPARQAARAWAHPSGSRVRIAICVPP